MQPYILVHECATSERAHQRTGSRIQWWISNCKKGQCIQQNVYEEEEEWGMMRIEDWWIFNYPHICGQQMSSFTHRSISCAGLTVLQCSVYCGLWHILCSIFTPRVVVIVFVLSPRMVWRLRGSYNQVSMSIFRPYFASKMEIAQ